MVVTTCPRKVSMKAPSSMAALSFSRMKSQTLFSDAPSLDLPNFLTLTSNTRRFWFPECPTVATKRGPLCWKRLRHSGCFELRLPPHPLSYHGVLGCVKNACRMRIASQTNHATGKKSTPACAATITCRRFPHTPSFRSTRLRHSWHGCKFAHALGQMMMFTMLISSLQLAIAPVAIKRPQLLPLNPPFHSVLLHLGLHPWRHGTLASGLVLALVT